MPETTLVFAGVNGGPLGRSSSTGSCGRPVSGRAPPGRSACTPSGTPPGRCSTCAASTREKIRKSLGHHSWEFTASTYIHLGDDDLPDGAMLADLVGGPEGNTRATRPPETGRDAAPAVEAV